MAPTMSLQPRMSDYTVGVPSALGDVTIIRVPADDGTLTVFRVHRLILALASDYFAALFTRDNWAENQAKELDNVSSVIELPHQDPGEFREFLDFCYPNIRVCVNQTNISGLLRACDRYLCPSLKEECAEVLNRMPVSYQVLGLSYEYGFEKVCQKSIEWCLRQPDLMWNEEFMQVDVALQNYILRMALVQDQAKSSPQSCPECKKYAIGVIAMVRTQPIYDPKHRSCLVNLLPKLRRLLPFSLQMVSQFRIPLNSRTNKNPKPPQDHSEI